MKKIILASGSPRRKQLLELAGIPFEVVVSNIDESFSPEMDPFQVAKYIAEKKALSVQKTLVNGDAYTIIAADTVVVLNHEFLGKPADRGEAIHILSKLSGKIHHVITGVCILSGSYKNVFEVKTEVEFFPLTKEKIEYYVDTYKPYDKAGAYAIQEWIGAVGIKSIKGDFYNVMGLPISGVVAELEKLHHQ
ncbi:septum formation protein Maf [Hanamia caeni]|jgi:septum formation protein|uniref:dTTP/UTP pyrophosphatase n=1 Tax=Hanamia caeni TaxID=2294116 RepID=A0A3M9NCW3_9BACT|nr:Maf family protein [Hanamia caeni]RNI35629.1 septum formation protein Maf [Hanamia caeni]